MSYKGSQFSKFQEAVADGRKNKWRAVFEDGFYLDQSALGVVNFGFKNIKSGYKTLKVDSMPINKT